uniref:Juvenile hormone acid O-methyltransferase n=1 Tax=Eurygaster integriceps TaxID=555972 RepID=A0AA49X7A1_9HEMI|nr:juvenile hormone acid O-methyltransferase [Eurygaster integriceps]
MNNPEEYVKCNGMQTKDAKEMLADYENYFKWTEGERVMDVGCGPGDVTLKILCPFLPKDCTVVAVDVSEDMISYARLFIAKDKERVTFRALDIAHEDQLVKFDYWKQQKKSFNKVFSFYCLQWIQNHRQAMINIYSLLKPSGEILLMFPTPDNPVYRAVENLRKTEKWGEFYEEEEAWFYKADDPPTYFQEILKNVGFEDIKCYLKQCSYEFSSWESLTQFLKSVNPYISYIPGDMHTEYLKELADSMLENNAVEPVGDTGKYMTKYDLLVALAKKPS